MADSMPSKVLHIRNLPEECTEMDLRSLSCQFGLVNRVLFLSRKQQAFVEFSTIEEAATMLATCQAQPIRLGTRNLIAQFSNKQEITIPVSDPNSRAAGTDGRILLVTVTDVQFPVTLEVIYQVFGMCGTITKLVIFNKQGKEQALVQFERAEDAAVAMERFQGKNIYSGCNTLNIQYSNLPDITVKYNNDRSYDFTNPTLPAGEQGLGGDALLSARFPGMPGPGAPPNAKIPTQPGGFGGAALGGAARGLYGGGLGGGGAFGGMDLLAAGGGGFGGGPAAGGMMPQFPFMGGAGRGGAGAGAGVGYKRLHEAISHDAADGGRSPVVLVNNLDPDRATPDALFNLFSTCGMVLRVKVLFAKRDSALVQFESADQAERARMALTGCPIWGRTLLVSPSKHPSIQAQRTDAEPDSARLSADYTSSNLHRRGPAASGGRGVPLAMPSKLLHVSSIPDSMPEEGLVALFAEHGPVVKVKFLPAKADPTRAASAGAPRKMALIELVSVDKAAEAICALHNRQVEQARLRISFSTSQSTQ